MRGVWAVCKCETFRYFATPLGWVLLTLFLLVQGYSYYGLLALHASSEVLVGTPFQLFFGGTMVFWLFLLLTTSLISMRLIPGKSDQGGLILLLSAPADEWAMVLGKYLAALFFYLVLWLPTTSYVLVVARGAGGVDLGPIFAGYLGVFCIGASCLAIGLVCSAVATTQLVAAAASFAVTGLLALASLAGEFIHDTTLTSVLTRISLVEQMRDFARGIVDLRHVVFHISVVFVCLTLASWVLRSKRWR